MDSPTMSLKKTISKHNGRNSSIVEEFNVDDVFSDDDDDYVKPSSKADSIKSKKKKSLTSSAKLLSGFKRLPLRHQSSISSDCTDSGADDIKSLASSQHSPYRINIKAVETDRHFANRMPDYCIGSIRDDDIHRGERSYSLDITGMPGSCIENDDVEVISSSAEAIRRRQQPQRRRSDLLGHNMGSTLTLTDWQNRFVTRIESDINTLESLTQPMRNSDYTIHSGAPGIAALYLRMSRVRLLTDHGGKDHHRALQQSCEDWLRNSLSYLRRKSLYKITFFMGDPGAWAISVDLKSRTGDMKEAQRLVKFMLALKDSFVNDTHVENELFYGRAGLLYAFSYVRRVMPRCIDGDLMKKLGWLLLRVGQDTVLKYKEHCVKTGPPPLLWEWNGKVYFGMAHGVAGILMVLLQVPELMKDTEARRLVKDELVWLLNQRFPSGNIPSSLNGSSDNLVQWCHGAAGHVLVFAEAYRVLGDEIFLQGALDLADVVWARGLLKKWPSICHGISGNGYAFLALYRLTKDLQHLYRAFKFGEFTLDREFITSKCKQSDTPSGLMCGLPGLIHYYADLCDPTRSYMPGCELPPILS